MAKPLKLKTKKKSGSSIFSVKFIGGAKQAFFYSLPYILCLTAAGLLFGSVMTYAMNSPTFRLSEVKILNAGTMMPLQAFRCVAAAASPPWGCNHASGFAGPASMGFCQPRQENR